MGARVRADLARAVELVRGGMSYGEAAKKVGGLTRNAVSGACHRAGLVTGREFSFGDGSRTALAVALHRSGKSNTEIAEEMGIEPGSVGSLLFFARNPRS